MREDPVVKVDATQIVYHRPGREADRLLWSEVQAVILETNALGPFATDVFWVLVGNHGEVVIPSGIQGEDALLDQLQQLPGFDNEAVIAAMSCTEEARFLCWQRAGDERER